MNKTVNSSEIRLEFCIENKVLEDKIHLNSRYNFRNIFLKLYRELR